jgi:transposase
VGAGGAAAAAPSDAAAPVPRTQAAVDDRIVLAGIVFVLKTGITWNQLPAELIGCSGVTCWRRCCR